MSWNLIGKEEDKGRPSREKARQKHADSASLYEQKDIGVIWLVGVGRGIVSQTFWQEESQSFMSDLVLKSLHWSMWEIQ